MSQSEQAARERLLSDWLCDAQLGCYWPALQDQGYVYVEDLIHTPVDQVDSVVPSLLPGHRARLRRLLAKERERVGRSDDTPRCSARRGGSALQVPASSAGLSRGPSQDRTAEDAGAQRKLKKCAGPGKGGTRTHRAPAGGRNAAVPPIRGLLDAHQSFTSASTRRAATPGRRRAGTPPPQQGAHSPGRRSKSYTRSASLRSTSTTTPSPHPSRQRRQSGATEVRNGETRSLSAPAPQRRKATQQQQQQGPSGAVVQRQPSARALLGAVPSTIPGSVTQRSAGGRRLSPPAVARALGRSKAGAGLSSRTAGHPRPQAGGGDARRGTKQCASPPRLSGTGARPTRSALHRDKSQEPTPRSSQAGKRPGTALSRRYERTTRIVLPETAASSHEDSLSPPGALRSGPRCALAGRVVSPRDFVQVHIPPSTPAMPSGSAQQLPTPPHLTNVSPLATSASMAVSPATTAQGGGLWNPAPCRGAEPPQRQPATAAAASPATPRTFCTPTRAPSAISGRGCDDDDDDSLYAPAPSGDTTVQPSAPHPSPQRELSLRELSTLTSPAAGDYSLSDSEAAQLPAGRTAARLVQRQQQQHQEALRERGRPAQGLRMDLRVMSP
eukprot:TRINITY_DN11876_c0_g5_i1.p1 TRINITY_DN11876_c0_g5~~TRINITY_DN11876_c0_g5_i1.p1  ORF type:complete len:648 (+),score=120.24 TRINITY_DN11876_c0_g5_i1:109-1944(+)